MRYIMGAMDILEKVGEYCGVLHDPKDKYRSIISGLKQTGRGFSEQGLGDVRVDIIEYLKLLEIEHLQKNIATILNPFVGKRLKCRVVL